MESEKEFKVPANGYANLVNDYMFKRVFGSEECKDILMTFLNHIIGGQRIEDVVFLPTEHLGPTDDDRAAVFDISCRSSNGDEFIVEMQNAAQPFFRDRALFYTCYPIINQAALAKERYYETHGNTIGFTWNFYLKPVRFIAITQFAIDHGQDWKSDMYHSSYRLREDNVGELLHDKLQFIFLELARFNKKDDELETPYDKWMYLLKNMSKLKSRPTAFCENDFDRLFEIAEFVNFTPEQFRDYQRSEKMIYDYQNTLDYARQKGLEQGIEQGIEQGLEQGREQGREQGLEQGREEERLRIACRMIESGMSLSQIIDLTGLAEEDIEKLNP